MKFTQNWLCDYLENFELEDVLDSLPQIGLEIETIVPAKKLTGFALAEIIKIVPHPNAERLRLVFVRLAKGEYGKQIVCGAPNLRVGQITVLAQPNAVIPKTNKPLALAEIRGQESAGMLCSSDELGIDGGENDDGILDLSQKDLSKDVAEVLGLDDFVIDVETTPNRPDWSGVMGIARDLAASGCGKFIPAKKIELKETIKNPIEITANFNEKNPSPCPFFTGRYIGDVKNSPSPDWMQKRLRSIGLRPINALVDITNYICFDEARPLHIYDADKINNNILLRWAKNGERFNALDGKSYVLDEKYCVIADEEKTLALGGVMGGVNSSVQNNTKNIFIESAYFEPTLTALTSRNLNIKSDSSYRFERGVDPASTLLGSNRAAKMVIDICGGNISTMVSYGTQPSTENKIYFVPQQIEKLSGMEIAPNTIKTFLDALGFETKLPKNANEKWQTQPPSWRRDFSPSDKTTNATSIAELTEEIIRLYGVEEIAETPLPAFSNSQQLELGNQKLRHLKKARVALAVQGLIETISWSFQAEEVAAYFCENASNLRIKNPISEALSVMRPSLLGSLLLATQRNLSYGEKNLAFFEAGHIFQRPEPEAQTLSIAAIRQGQQNRHWKGHEIADIWKIKADMLAALSACSIKEESLRFTDETPEYLHPSKAGTAKIGNKTIAVFGEIHPSILTKLDIASPCVVFEINLDAIPISKKNKKTQKSKWQKNPLQPVRRDFAFIVDKILPADDLREAAAFGLKKLKIKNEIIIFDVFENEKLLGENKKSLTIEVTLYPDKVLNDEEIETICQKLIDEVKEKTNGVLRG